MGAQLVRASPYTPCAGFLKAPAPFSRGAGVLLGLPGAVNEVSTMALSGGQREALERTGVSVVASKLETGSKKHGADVIRFDGAHITRYDAESWLEAKTGGLAPSGRPGGWVAWVLTVRAATVRVPLGVARIFAKRANGRDNGGR